MIRTAAGKFASAVKNHRMLEGRKTAVVGFSGGADSALLLVMMAEVLGTGNVLAIHVNHMIRGEEADRDEKFCRDFCSERGIPFRAVRVDIPMLAKERGTGLEETARNERYRIFAVAMREGYDCTATAHNASDNAETVLFNLIRGAGTNGLSGIPPVRGSIIRPLILCTKDEIVSECGRRGIPFVFDSTNDDTDYTRNFIRHRIVPLAKEINPAFEDAVSSSSEILRRDRAHFDSLSSQYSLSSGRKILSSLDDAVLSRVLLDSLRNAGISPDSEHITNAAEMIRSEKVRSSLSLPGGVFSIDRDNLRAGFPDTPDGTVPSVLCEGVTVLSEDTAAVFVRSSADSSKYINPLKNIYKLSIHVSADSAKINDVVSARERRPGDRYPFGGMTRNVKKLLQSTKLPLETRRFLPVFTVGDEIIWLPGFPVSDRFRPCGDQVAELWFFSENNSDSSRKE